MSTGTHTFKELWDLVEPVVRSEGLELYDIERASNGNAGGVIRVFLTKAGEEAAVSVVDDATDSPDEASLTQGGVTVDDCAAISRKLSAIDRFEEFLGEHSVLEVSSPGINRKLRTASHFQASIGERIAVKAYFDDLGKEKKVVGYLLSCVDEKITIKEAVGGAEREIEISDLSNARIDFDFSSPNSLQKPQKGGNSKRGKKKQRKN